MILEGTSLWGEASKNYINDVQALKVEELNTLNIPRFSELSIKQTYPKIIEKFPDIEPYFPHYDHDYCPPRRFFWVVFSSLHSKVCKKIINKAQVSRVANPDGKDGELVWIRDDILENIHLASYESSKLDHNPLDIDNDLMVFDISDKDIIYI